MRKYEMDCDSPPSKRRIFHANLIHLPKNRNGGSCAVAAVLGDLHCSSTTATLGDLEGGTCWAQFEISSNKQKRKTRVGVGMLIQTCTVGCGPRFAALFPSLRSEMMVDLVIVDDVCSYINV